jgi:hypothetical protein
METPDDELAGWQEWDDDTVSAIVAAVVDGEAAEIAALLDGLDDGLTPP